MIGLFTNWETWIKYEKKRKNRKPGDKTCGPVKVHIDRVIEGKTIEFDEQVEWFRY